MELRNNFYLPKANYVRSLSRLIIILCFRRWVDEILISVVRLRQDIKISYSEGRPGGAPITERLLFVITLFAVSFHSSPD